MRKGVIVLLLLAAACKQGVTVEFEADPEFVCVPGETELSWDVKSVGTPAITVDVVDAEPASFLFPDLPHETTSAIAELNVAVPEGRTEFQLTARARGKSASESVFIVGLGSESVPGGFIFEPDCSDTGAFNGWTSVELSSYDSSISPRGVTNTSDRPIQIVHAGISQALAPGDTSSAWNRTSLNGQWSVSAGLLSRARRGAEMVTESCDPRVGPGGSVSPTPGDSTRTVQVARLTAAFTFGCD